MALTVQDLDTAIEVLSRLERVAAELDALGLGITVTVNVDVVVSLGRRPDE